MPFRPTAVRQFHIDSVVLYPFYALMSIDGIQKELDHMRGQIVRQRRDIRDLEWAGIDPTSANALLARMVDKVAALVTQRDNEVWSDRPKYPGTGKWIRSTQRRA